MKFKNPIDYVKNIANKFKELVNFPYKRKIYTGILIIFLLFSLAVPFCFMGAYTVVPSENDKKVVAGIIKELNCYPAGFKHGPRCKLKIDNYVLAEHLVDGLIETENNQKTYIRDLFNVAYNDKKCIHIQYYNSLIYKLEYCNGEVIYLFKNFENLYFQRKNFTMIGIFLLVCGIFAFLLLNKEFKKENQIFNKAL